MLFGEYSVKLCLRTKNTINVYFCRTKACLIDIYIKINKINERIPFVLMNAHPFGYSSSFIVARNAVGSIPGQIQTQRLLNDYFFITQKSPQRL